MHEELRVIAAGGRCIGNSRSPLYVTAAGIPAGEAAAHVAEMSGELRVPTLLTLVDRLSRR